MLTTVLNALRIGASSAWGFIRANPYIVFVLGLLALGYFFFLRPAYNTIDERDATIATRDATIDSLNKQAATLRLDRARAIATADSALKKSQAIKDEIRTTVNALPAAERTKLNRQLLSSLDLID